MDSLLTFLEQFGKKQILFGHNIQSFDCPVLMHALQACNKVSEFTEVVDGFVDTLKLFNFVKPGLSSYRQENLCECLSGIVYTANNAIGDVFALKTLVQSYFTSSELDKPDIQRCSVTVQSVKASYLYSCQIRLNLPSLSCTEDHQSRDCQENCWKWPPVYSSADSIQ